MVLPILEAKYDLGLFDHPYVDESKVDAVLNRPEGLALERKLAGPFHGPAEQRRPHSAPLESDQEGRRYRPAWRTPRRTSRADGPWKACLAAAAKSHPVTVLAGIKNKRGPDAQITFVAGPRPSNALCRAAWIVQGKKARPAANPEEIADWITQGEGCGCRCRRGRRCDGRAGHHESGNASRATLDLPGIQEQMLEAVRPRASRSCWCLKMAARSTFAGPREHVPAILEAWYPGTEGGDAVADVLFGDVNPGGKLPVSWPRTAGSEPLYYNHNLTHEPEDAPNFTSRYWDINSKPLYPFGYGLSYTTFKFANLQLSKTSMPADGATEVYVDVTNTGSIPGDAVAQIYIHQRYGSASRPVRQLKGFERVSSRARRDQDTHVPARQGRAPVLESADKAWIVEPSTLTFGPARIRLQLCTLS